MATTNFQSVDEYLAAQPESARPMLEQVRAAIREALPIAEEIISYQMPAYRVAGRVAIYFAGWKNHYSLYPVGREDLAGLSEGVPDFEVDLNDKGTARFPLDEPVPTELISHIARRLGAPAQAATAARAAARRSR